jgi:RNA polymerase sigma factor (sigma-70 family)
MSREPFPSALRDLRALFDSGTAAGLTDDQLLRRYVERRAESAFAALVDRHGPMVWGVCRRALGRAHEAEDAFQATFLILARRAEAVRVDGSLGRWLHGVASRVAARARHDGHRRLAREARAATHKPSSHVPDFEKDELLAILDEELARLPEKYRSPMVLCHLEGLTYAEAAEQLGCPPGAIKGRLSRGLELLRTRLTRRGLGLPTSALILQEPRPSVPPSLAESAARIASATSHPSTIAGLSSSALTLSKGVIRTMIVMRWAKLLVFLSPAPLGLWFLVESPTPKQAAPPQPAVEAKIASARVPLDEPDRQASAIAVPLPGPEELRDLLRKTAEEATAIASKEPQPLSWDLTTIAKAQALVRGSAGARATFTVAAREAGGDLGGKPSGWNLWRVGHFQAEAGFRDDARLSLRRALEATPEVARNTQGDTGALQTLAVIVQEQAGLGDLDEARRCLLQVAISRAP